MPLPCLGRLSMGLPEPAGPDSVTAAGRVCFRRAEHVLRRHPSQ
jgi:hypothetical protein